tara:strand:+ start:1202 stop:1426 length:225 start_codon:yes stop_codon:yes gene_type:complete
MSTDTTLILPQIREKIDDLPSAERRLYIQELIGRYETKRTRVHKASRQIAREWAEGQKAHFEGIIAELNNLLNS